MVQGEVDEYSFATEATQTIGLKDTAQAVSVELVDDAVPRDGIEDEEVDLYTGFTELDFE